MTAPRVCAWASAFAAGVLISQQTGRFAGALGFWVALLVLVAAGWAPRSCARWARRSRWSWWAWLAALVAVAGAARAAWETRDRPGLGPPPPGVDDRAGDVIAGVVAGPVEDASGRRSFAVEAGERVWISVREPLPDVLPGDRVEVRGRLRRPRGFRVPGAVDARRLAAARGAFLEARGSGRDVEVIERAAELSAWRLPVAIQRAAARVIERRGRGDVDGELGGELGGERRGESGAAVVRAMAVGDRGGLTPEIRARFRDAGVAHVLAVSGLHLAVVALLAFAAARRGWAAVPALAARLDPARAAALVAAPAAIAFTVVSGARTSTMRALLVVLIVLAGHALGRRARVIDALGAAALVLLALRPSALWDPSFQLSFSAALTLALALGSRRERRQGREGRGDREARGTSGAGRLAVGVEPRPAVRLAYIVRTAAPRAAVRLAYIMRAAAPRAARWAARWIGGLVRASVWASVATAPFTALSFGTVATGGIVANVVVVPAAELVIVPLGLLGCALSAVWEPLGGPALDLAIAAAGWVDAFAGAVARFAPVLRVPPPTGWQLAAALALWLAAIARARRAWTRAGAGIVAAAALAVTGLSAWHDAHVREARASLVVTFLDVGQGDAAVLELPGGEVWLIDAGGLPFVYGFRTLDPDVAARLAELPGERAVARFLAWRRISHIDVAVISHPHPDHYAGLRAVARTASIGELWLAAEPADGSATEPTDGPTDGPAAVDPATSQRALVAALRARGTRVVHPRLGQPVIRRGVSVTALGPRYLGPLATADPVMTTNDNSLVLLVEFAGRRLLFTGDIEEEGELRVLAEHAGGGQSGDSFVSSARVAAGEPGALSVDVVKVPHHGSRTSSTAAFVRATRPRLAIISCGVANRFGFPAAEVTERWQAIGARALRTDRAGAITVTIEPDGALRASCFDPEGDSACRALAP